MNKKGMLGNLIGGFLVILIGISLLPTIINEVNSVENCYLNNTLSSPLKETNSFGGGGSGQFGGYDGQVKKSWDYPVNETIILSGDCPEMEPLTGAHKSLINLIILFFVLVIATAALAITFSGLGNSGLV